MHWAVAGGPPDAAGSGPEGSGESRPRPTHAGAARGSDVAGFCRYPRSKAETRFPTMLDRCSEFGLNPWNGRFL